LPLSIIMEKCLEQIFILVQASTIDMNTWRFKMQKPVRRQVITWNYNMSLKLEPGMVKCIFPFTHANKPQQFNCKMNVVLVNFEKKHEDECKHSSSLCMNGSFHSSNVRMKKTNCIYMFLINRSIKITDNYFILSLKIYGFFSILELTKTSWNTI
jgi:hypothetical protein